MKKLVKRYANKVAENISNRIIKKSTENASLADKIAFRVILETMVNRSTIGKTHSEIFYGISDDFWFWINTEGVRKNAVLRSILPGMPDENTQKMFTGDIGDQTLSEGFHYYSIVKEQFQKYKGDISLASVLDFGCGWGRIIRFFLKDVPTSKLWGCDPELEMIKMCKEQNKWSNFETINPYPPTCFQDNSFDLIYSYSVFSHLSETLHLKLLPELKRILKPGGIYMTTTRNRKFIEDCNAFSDKGQSLSIFDRGLYCHHSYEGDKRGFWGETAIPKKYVLDNWTDHFSFLEFIEHSAQNVIIVQKQT